MKTKIIKWLILGSLAMVLALCSFLVACQSSESAEEAAPAVSSGEEAAAAQDVITLKVEMNMADTGGGADSNRWFIDQIERRTDGRVKFEVYWLNSLIPSGHIVEGLAANTADMAYVNMSGEAGRLPLMSIADLPGFSKDPRVLMRASYALAQTQPLIDEFSKNNIKFLANCPSELMCVFCQEPITCLDDIAGKKLLGLGVGAKIGAALGASVVSMPPAEARSAGEKGVIEGVIFPIGSVARPVYSLAEWNSYYYEIPGSMPSFVWSINADTFASLPGDIQTLLTDSDFIQELEQVTFLNQTLKDSYKGLEMWLDAGFSITLPTEEDNAKMLELIQPIKDEWAADKESQGLPGNEVYESWSNFIEEYELFYTYPRVSN